MPVTILKKSHYELLAALRHALRRFLNFSQDVARVRGLTPQQHQALLALKGYPGRDYASVGELATRLHLRHHSAVGLVDRLVRRGLLRRVRSSVDRRRAEIRLTARGDTVIARLSSVHLQELRHLGPELYRLIGTVIGITHRGARIEVSRPSPSSARAASRKPAHRPTPRRGRARSGRTRTAAA